MLTVPLSVRPLAASDRDAWIAAHGEVFGPGASSPELWHWSYDESPLGTRALVLTRGDEVLGSFAARAVHARRGALELRLGFAIDLFVTTRANAGLGRGAQFERLARAFFERYGGRDFEALFGWPAPAALRIGQRRLGFEPLEEQVVWMASTTAEEGTPSAVEVVESDTCVDGLGKIWERNRDPDELALERDDAWLRWRFDRHPAHHYRKFGVRTDGDHAGFCIARGGAGLPEELWAIAEWSAPRSQDETAEALLSAVRRAARAAGVRMLAFGLPAGSRWGPWLGRRGFERRRTARTLACRPFGRLAADELRRGLAWQAGDDDLI